MKLAYENFNLLKFTFYLDRKYNYFYVNTLADNKGQARGCYFITVEIKIFVDNASRLEESFIDL